MTQEEMLNRLKALEYEVQDLRRALRPFVLAAELAMPELSDDTLLYYRTKLDARGWQTVMISDSVPLCLGDLRYARDEMKGTS